MARHPGRCGKASAVPGLGLLLPLLLVALAGCTGQPILDEEGFDVAAGEAAFVPFSVGEGGTVHVAVESRNATPFGVCVIPAADVAAWQDGAHDGSGCSQNVRQASSTQALAAGEWVVAVRCEAPSQSCRLAARAFET